MAGTFTCSEDEDFGSLGDNKVIVTGGTSGVPADFAAFVTADRAGEAVLLAATAGLSPTLALTFALRPVEALALLISFIVAAKTAEADFIFITGTDFAGNAQTESLDVTAGNGTYVSTKYFATISNIDCSDNSAGGGTQWADGTVRVTQPRWGFIWDFDDAIQYQVDSLFEVGNGSTSTFFGSKREQVHLREDFETKGSATTRLGLVVNSQSSQGSMWVLDKYPIRITANVANAGIEVYDSHMVFGEFGPLFQGNPIIFKDSTLEHYAGNQTFAMDAATLVNVRVNGMILEFKESPSTMTDVFIQEGLQGIFIRANATVTGPEIGTISQPLSTYRTLGNQTLVLIDPITVPTQSTCNIGGASGEVQLEFTVNVHVADRAGANLGSATVLLEDQAAAQIFSLSTDANGDITEQNVQAKKWVGTSETETDNSPFKFTISKAGYETLVLEAVTIDGPIVWHLELQRSASINAGLIS